MGLSIIISLALLIFSASADVAKNVVIEKSFVQVAKQQQRNSGASMRVTNQGGHAALFLQKPLNYMLISMITESCACEKFLKVSVQ